MDIYEVIKEKNIDFPGKPIPAGNYSLAVKAGDFVFTSGQIPLAPETGLLVGETIEEQTHRVCMLPLPPGRFSWNPRQTDSDVSPLQTASSAAAAYSASPPSLWVG